MYQCHKVKDFNGVPSSKGYLYYLVLGNGVSLEVEKSTYSKVYMGDIISYYVDHNNKYLISRIFRKNRDIKSNNKRYNVVSV
jgi:hypothetical protein